MIYQYKEEETGTIKGIVKEHIFENIYCYLDMYTYGLENENIMTWILADEKEWKVLVYKYYNSIQLFQIAEPSKQEVQELALFLEKQQYEMISGNEKLITQVNNQMSGYIQSNGVILEKVSWEDEILHPAQIAKYEECEEIAKLICENDDIGGHYSVDLLKSQLEDRMEKWGCKSVILTEDGQIAAHMATYAEYGDVAVLGGLITRESCQGKGYGRSVFLSICKVVADEEKKPVLYCYDADIVPWYEAKGCKVKCHCAKLERKR